MRESLAGFFPEVSKSTSELQLFSVHLKPFRHPWESREKKLVSEFIQKELVFSSQND